MSSIAIEAAWSEPAGLPWRGMPLPDAASIAETRSFRSRGQKLSRPVSKNFKTAIEVSAGARARLVRLCMSCKRP